MAENNKKQRTRRSSIVVERDILNAVSDAIREIGFSRLSLKEVLDRGHVSLPVVYGHFGSLQKLIDLYVTKHDYWLNNAIDIDPSSVSSPREYYLMAAESLVKAFYKNRELQQLFIWELAEDNATTRHTSHKREAATEELVNHFDSIFKGSDIDIKAVTAVIIAGIYHITLRKDRSTFCHVDFSKKAGQARLIEAVKVLINLIFDSLEEKQRINHAIQTLLADGVSESIICKAFGIDKVALNENSI